MNIQNTVIAPLLVAGALGFVNYSILSRLDIINLTKEMKEDKNAYMMLFGTANYFLFTFLQYLFSRIFTEEVFSNAISFLITCVVTITGTYLTGEKIGKQINRCLNRKREKSGKSIYDSRSVKNISLNLDESCPMYVYDFDNKLIFAGYSGWFSTSEELDFEFTMVPFNDKPKMYEYEELLEYVESIDVESKVYINTDKKIKIILLTS